MPRFDPKELKSWQIDVGGALVAVLLTCAAYWLKVGPDLQHHDDARARAGQLHAETDKRRQFEASLRAADDQLKSVHQYVARHKFALQSSTRLNEHVSALGDLAARAGLQLDGVEPGRETVGPSYTTVPIRMTGRGRFQQIVSYLASVRAAMPDKGVSGWEIAANPSPHAPTAGFTFNLVWYAAPKSQVARN